MPPAAEPPAPVEEEIIPSQDTEPIATPPVTPAAEPPAFPVHGLFSTRYRLRATNDDDDQDLYGHLRLDLGEAARQPLTAHFFLRGTADIDGSNNRRGYHEFDSITDTYDDNFNGRFYYGYADLHSIDFLETARFGRQLVYDTPLTFHFDGGRVETREFFEPLWLQAGVYGGVPVHLFESSPEGDQLLGAFLSSRPWTGGRLRLDYTGVRDDRRLGLQDNDLWGLSGWQNLAQKLNLYGRYTRLEASSRDLEGRATFNDAELDLQVQFSYYNLLTTQRAQTTELDPFYQSLQDLHPYRLFSGTVYKGFGEHLGLTVGFAQRELEQESDESSFNHEYVHAYVRPALSDFPWDGFHVEVSGDLWDATGNDFHTVGGEISQELSEELRVAVGSSYALYKYDYFLDTERDRTRAYYTRWDWQATESVAFRFDYEYERDSFDEYHTLDMRVTLEF